MLDRLRSAAAAVAVLLAAGCSSGAVGEPIDEPPTPGPLVAERELWRNTATDTLSFVRSASLHGETALLLGGGTDGPGLAAVEAATGKPRWHLRESDPVPRGDGTDLYWSLPQMHTVVEDPLEGLLVFVPYTSYTCTQSAEFCRCANGSCEEVGIAALSGTDASLRWAVPLPAGGSTGHVAVEPRAVSEGLLVVGMDDPFSNDPGSLRTVAMSTSDGSRRWERSGVVADFIAGDTVVGWIPTTDVAFNSPPAGPSADGRLVALDAASGQQRWDLSERYAAPVADLVAGDLVLVRAQAQDEDGLSRHARRSLIVEARTGNEIVDFGTQTLTCASDARTLIACSDPDDKVVSFRLDDRRVRASRRSIDAGEGFVRDIHGIWGGRLLVEYAQREGSDYVARHVVVDRSANVLTGPAPGPIVAVSDRYAIYRVNEDGIISLHAVTP